MSEWREVSLGEVVEQAGGFIKTGPFGSQLHAEEYTTDPDGVPVVMPKDMVSGRVARESVSRVDQSVAERLRAHRLAPGDLVLARRGDVGRFAFIEDDEGGWLCGTGAMRVHAPNEEVICPRFLRYAMARPRVADWLMGQAVGATMPNLNGAIVAEIPLRVPAPLTQRRVSTVLAAFGEIIEINERRIELLEDLARSLYREWFVRFRFPGHEGHLPNGSVPDGWEVQRLGDVATINGLSERAANLPDPLRYLDISAVAPRRMREALTMRASEAPSRARRCVRDGDTIWAMVRPNRRAHAIVHSPPSDLIVSTGFAVLTPVRVPSAFLFEHTSSPEFTEHLTGRATGAAYPAVRPDDFSAVPIVIPSRDLLAKFAELADPALRQVSVLNDDNRALARTRDLLLPRLVTGRLDISDLDLDGLLQEEGGE